MRSKVWTGNFLHIQTISHKKESYSFHSSKFEFKKFSDPSTTSNTSKKQRHSFYFFGYLKFEFKKISDSSTTSKKQRHSFYFFGYLILLSKNKNALWPPLLQLFCYFFIIFFINLLFQKFYLLLIFFLLKNKTKSDSLFCQLIYLFFFEKEI